MSLPMCSRVNGVSPLFAFIAISLKETGLIMRTVSESSSKRRTLGVNVRPETPAATYRAVVSIRTRN